jgi:hypothetical protein
MDQKAGQESKADLTPFLPQYQKSTRGAKTPDYLIKDAPTKLAVEIGGPSKGRQLFKGINIDRKIVFVHSPVPEKGRLPLFLLGYLT